MSNPYEEPGVPEVQAQPEDAENPDEAVGDYVDDPMAAGEDQ